jgi:hypothetical protein
MNLPASPGYGEPTSPLLSFVFSHRREALPMESLKHYVLNGLFFISSAMRAMSFRKAASDPQAAQEMLLCSILRKNRATAFGKVHDFGAIGSYEDYRARVPLSTYEDYIPFIERIASGEKKVLTTDDTLLFEPTSGSMSASKYIPYTSTLREQFQKSISAWLADLYLHHKSLFSGRAYWQITPFHRKEKKGKIPVGFDDDASYLGSFERGIVSRLLAVPSETAAIDSGDSFRYVTLLFLLMEHRLAFISVWNPTFLTGLLEKVPCWGASLIADLEQGALNPPEKLEPALHRKLLQRLRPSPGRASRLKVLLSKDPIPFPLVWPRLALISSWADGNAGAYVAGLEALFPGVPVQPKGLIATEAFVTFPLSGLQGHVLALESHFFEFLEPGFEQRSSIEKPHLAHELEKGCQYSIVVTTGGGLYRYMLRDVAEVVGYYQKTPLLTFLGREDGVSDHAGEKLNPVFVERVLKELLGMIEPGPHFYMLAPEQSREKSLFYTLFLQGGLTREMTGQIISLRNELEKKLSTNFHYRSCREVGQLGEVQVFLIDSSLCSGPEAYLRRLTEEGRRLGSIKPAALHGKTGWSEWFQGEFISYPGA